MDLSQNKIQRLGDQLSSLTDLKILNVDQNAIVAGGLKPISTLTKLQTLSAGGNKLGSPVPRGPKHPNQPTPSALPVPLPPSLKQLKLDANAFSSVPMSIVAKPHHLIKLEKLDLSSNNLAALPVEIANLISLADLNLDNNVIVSLPECIGQLKKLKALSLRHNRLQVSNTNFSATNPQPLPASLFRDTLVIDLNLHGNPMTNTQLNEFEGIDTFLERRQKVKTTGIYGGAMTSMEFTGLH